MLPTLETHVAALRIDRELTLRRAERRALLLSALERPSHPQDPTRAEPTQAWWFARTDVVRRVRWVLRPLRV